VQVFDSENRSAIVHRRLDNQAIAVPILTWIRDQKLKIPARSPTGTGDRSFGQHLTALETGHLRLTDESIANAERLGADLTALRTVRESTAEVADERR
jgi:hypothetical protein